MSRDSMVTLSKAAQEAMWGDAAILRYLEMAREHFEIGERSALFEVLCLCARFQAVIPEWAADALFDAQRSLEHGETKDFNDAFGWDGESQAVRERSARLARIEKDVLIELQDARLDGASLAPDDIFDIVCESLRMRGMQVSRRDVESLNQTEVDRLTSRNAEHDEVPAPDTYEDSREAVGIRELARPNSLALADAAPRSLRTSNMSGMHNPVHTGAVLRNWLPKRHDSYAGRRSIADQSRYAFEPAER